MHYYIDKGFAYYHIPKCGGESIKHWLMEQYDKGNLGKNRERIGDTHKHEPLSVKAKFIDKFEDVVIITTVRNPFEIPVSLYNFVRKNGVPDWCKGLEIVSGTFEQFIYWYKNNWLSVFDWLKIDGKIPDNLQIIKLEDLKIDMRIHHYTGTGKDCMKCYTPETFNIIKNKERWLVEYYESSSE